MKTYKYTVEKVIAINEMIYRENSKQFDDYDEAQHEAYQLHLNKEENETIVTTCYEFENGKLVDVTIL